MHTKLVLEAILDVWLQRRIHRQSHVCPFLCIFTCFSAHGERFVCIFTCAHASAHQDVCIFTCAGEPGEPGVPHVSWRCFKSMLFYRCVCSCVKTIEFVFKTRIGGLFGRLAAEGCLPIPGNTPAHPIVFIDDSI